MRPLRKVIRRNRRGIALIVSLIFVLIFSALAVSMAGMTSTNAQLAHNQHKVNAALAAAQSGADCALYIVSTVSLPQTGMNFVSDTEADETWSRLCTHLQTTELDGRTVNSAAQFSDALGAGDEIVTEALNFDDSGTTFTLRFYRYDGDPHTLYIQATGADGDVSRSVLMDMEITKDSQVLNYAIASRGRMWLTGDTTIHGDIFSSWDVPSISPFNMTSDSSVLGTINTVLTLDQIKNESYQMETLDANDNPMFDEYGNRIYSSDDEVQGYHEGINYDQAGSIPGMDISHYDTDMYNSGLLNVSSSSTVEVEYFPHASGNYNYPRDGSPSSTWNRRLERHVYENVDFTDVRLPDDRNALFRNCTFNGVLYIDCYKSGNYHYNNVRFEDCDFNGTIITDVPQQLKWQHNCLYFTGEANFNNQSGIDEATILAPHFNVNLGNTNPEQNDNNVLTGAIVGGIVDVRGNAQINGTIISMCDTTQWSSGYVTNIGATLDDGGSETTELGDIGVISVTPAQDQMLPSGITSPIIIRPLPGTYTEQ